MNCKPDLSPGHCSPAGVAVSGGASVSRAGWVGREWARLPVVVAASGRVCAVHAGGAVLHTRGTRGEDGRGGGRRAWRDRGRIAVGGGPRRGRRHGHLHPADPAGSYAPHGLPGLIPAGRRPVSSPPRSPPAPSASGTPTQAWRRPWSTPASKSAVRSARPCPARSSSAVWLATWPASRPRPGPRRTPPCTPTLLASPPMRPSSPSACCSLRHCSPRVVRCGPGSQPQDCH
jgi:hypothetical protein